ncbi:MAG: ABC transporter ATP-binding protein, partial [Devosia sp.]
EGQGVWTEYAGGYSDMVAQRGAGISAPAPEKRQKSLPQTASQPPSTPAPAQRSKLSFKQKHALETLPKEIERLAGLIAGLATRLADPALYARDPKAFETLSAELATAQHAKDAAEEQWLELEMLRESLEA